MRRLLTTLALVLLTGTLLWGECLACQHLLSAAKPATGCCQSSDKCKEPTPEAPAHKHCKTQGLAVEQYVQADVSKTQAILAPAVAVSADFAPPVVQAVVHPPLMLPGYSPPDRYLLYSSLLI